MVCKRSTQFILNQNHQKKVTILINPFSINFHSDYHHHHHHEQRPIQSQLQNAIKLLKLAKNSSNYPWKPLFESANIFTTDRLPEPISRFSQSVKMNTQIGPLSANQLSFQELISLELQLFKLEQQTDSSLSCPSHKLQIILSSWQLLHHYLGICDSHGNPNLNSINQAIRRFLKPIHFNLASISHRQFNPFPSQSHSPSPTRISNYLHNYLQHYAILHDRHHFNLQSLNLNQSILVQYLLIAIEINHKPLNKQLLKVLETANLSFESKTFIHLWKVLLNTSPHPSSPLLDWFTNHLLANQSLLQKTIHTISRLFASSLGILLTTLRNSFRKQQITEHDFYFRLNQMLNLIRSSSLKSPELSQRRIQILCLLPESNELSTEDLKYDDPYLLSTLFRTYKIDQMSSVIQATKADQDERRSLDLMRVIARSQGHLIHKNPSDGQLSLLCSSIATSEVDDPGLILSLSQVLVEKIKSSCFDQPASHEKMIKYLNQLLALSISSSSGLHGGSVEKSRLDHRKSQGVTILTNFLLSRSQSTPPSPKIFDILETCHPKLLQPNLLQELIHHHIKFSNDYTSHIRLLNLLKKTSTHLSFKSICPNDLPLLLLYQTFSNLSSNESFLEIQIRLKTFLNFLNAFGYPIRRFRGKRLLRLVFLSLRKFEIELEANQWKELEELVERSQSVLIINHQLEEEIEQKRIEKEVQKGFEMYKEQSLVYALATVVSDKVSGWFKVVDEKAKIGGEQHRRVVVSTSSEKVK